MTRAAFNHLAPGLYRVLWHTGGGSLAAIGMGPDGERWLAPTNWVAPVMTVKLRDLRQIAAVRRIQAGKQA